MSDSRVFPPSGSCDCHVHVIGPKCGFPLASPRSYTPMDATADDLLGMMDRLGVQRAVIVQPSIYGTDNDCTLDAVSRLGKRGRAVAVVEENIAGSDVDAMHRRGVRGLRLNLMSMGTPDPAAMASRIAASARVCVRNGWHLQIFAPPGHIGALEVVWHDLPVDVVFDHFALIRADAPDWQALSTVTRLLGEGRAWVKLSGTYRVADDAFDPRLAGVARRLIAAAADRVVWGSDWPHTPAHSGSNVSNDAELPYREIDTPRLIHSLSEWCEPDQAARILVDNPVRLYDFAPL